MICIDCKLAFPEEIKVCPKCSKNTIEDRRKVDRRRYEGDVEQDRRMSDRRKQLIKRFDEIFWKGKAKNC